MHVLGLSKQFQGQGDRVKTQNICRRPSFQPKLLPRAVSWALFTATDQWTAMSTKLLSVAALAMSLSACEAFEEFSLGAGSAPSTTDVAAEPSSVQTMPVAPTNSKFGPTAVGQKAAQLRSDFEKLKANTQSRGQQLDAVRGQTVANVNSFHSRVGAIRSRLQMGSTPGNPELLAEWSQAQTQITQIDADIATLNQLSAQVSGDAGSSAFILENIRPSFACSRTRSIRTPSSLTARC